MASRSKQHHDLEAELRARLRTLPLAELKRAVEEAILEHQRLLESEQTVYEEWEEACASGKSPLSVQSALEAECLRRRKNTFAQQDELAMMIDLLGYVPETQSNPTEADTF